MSRTRLNDDFARQVLSVVEEIPAGSVATYGQLACMIGRPKNARLVARVLSQNTTVISPVTALSTTPAASRRAGLSRLTCSARKARPSRMKRMSICGSRSGCARTEKKQQKRCVYGNAQRSVHAPFSAVLQAALHGRADERHVAIVLGTDGNIRVEQLFFRLFLVQKILIQQKRRPVALLERLLIEHEAQTVRL